MAKRPTIGKNPLDFRLGESPLDVVVPDLRARPPKFRPPLQGEEVATLKAQLAAKEAEIQALKAELARLQDGPPKTETSPRKAEPGSPKPEPRWVTLRKLGKL